MKKNFENYLLPEQNFPPSNPLPGALANGTAISWLTHKQRIKMKNFEFPIFRNLIRNLIQLSALFSFSLFQ